MINLTAPPLFELAAALAGLLELVRGAAEGQIVRFDAQVVDFGGGVGNLVAAALQTKGLIDQARILNDFKGILEWIAALSWLFSIAMAIASVAVFGNYRTGLYLLIGPPLFYYMITETVPTDGTRVLVGDRPITNAIEDQNRLLQWIGAIGGELQADDKGNPQVTNNKTVQVSFFFGVFDTIVTELTQKIVSVIVNTKKSNDLKFVAREKAMAFILDSVPAYSPLWALAITEHFGKCGEAISALQGQQGNQTHTPVDVRPKDDIENAEKKTIEGDKWTDKDHTLTRHVAEFLLSMQNATIDDQGTPFPPVPFDDPDKAMETHVSCEQIWDWLKASLIVLSRHLLKPETFQATFGEGSGEIPWEEAYNDVKEWLKGAPPGGGPSNEDPVTVLTAYLYKNIASQATHSALQSQVFGRSPFNSQEFEGVFGDIGNAESRGGYFQLRYFATAVPYVQGILLYLLSIAFPFFAVYLVIPSRATSFVVWCSLWVWVKSWDIGFALVFVARDIFWHLFNNRVNVFEKKINLDTPSDVISVAFSNDPTFTQNTYWVLISGLTLMVPVMTAHFCMGATGMFDMFRYTIDQTANRFGQIEANVGRRQAANKTEALIAEQNHMAKALVARAHARRQMAQVVGTDGRPVGHPGGAQTADGTPIAEQDFNKGTGYGGLQGSSDARPGFVGESYTWAGHILQNHNRNSRAEIGASLDRAGKIEQDNAKHNAEAGRIERPERIPNVHRGFASMDEDLTRQDMADYQDMVTQYRNLVGRLYGHGSTRYQRADAEVAEIAEMNRKGGRLKWDDFFEREGGRSNQLQDLLALQTRRRMTSLKRSEGRGAMLDLLNMRQENARFARNVLDGLNVKTVPGVGETLLNWASSGWSRPENPGQRYNGNLFRTTGRPDLGAGPADLDIDGPGGD